MHIIMQEKLSQLVILLLINTATPRRGVPRINVLIP